MKIKLENIGIIKESLIDLEGLTIITGDNNSGKTTVGKALYSLLDSVSNLQQKAQNDKRRYIISQIDSAYLILRIGKTFQPISDNELLNIFFNREYPDKLKVADLITFLSELTVAFTDVNIDELFSGVNSQDESDDSKRRLISKGVFEENLPGVLDDWKKTLEVLNKDPELIDYARRSIDRTLNKEFSSQIQPVSFPDAKSRIVITNDEKICFDMQIFANHIFIDKPVYYSSPSRSVFFIDDPFIMDEDVPPSLRSSRYYGLQYDETWLDLRPVLSHRDKLQTIIHRKNAMSIFEEGAIAAELKPILDIINDILPGEFISDSDGEFYVHNGIKLKTTNLATGSKLFSIIKILLQAGHLNSNTMLILDEPESHLHPSWQNILAEVVVVLVKELNVNILLTTHSPNLMLALDAYMRKYTINDITHFFQTQNIDGSVLKEYRCVDSEIGVIYEDFVQYLSEMKQLRNKYLENDKE